VAGFEANQVSRHRVRTAKPEDIEQLVRMRLALQNHISSVKLHLFGMSEKSVLSLTDKYLAEIQDKDVRIIAVEKSDSQTVVGMAIGKVVIRDDYDPERFGSIDDVWVDPEHRRQGLCRKMIEDLLRFFEQSAVQDIVLDYAVGSQESEEAWQAFGFQPALTIATAKLQDVKNRVKKAG
jgi:ribosomal protein S18 acetylase RimI-like enzyme